MLSPKNKAAPKMPSEASTAVRCRPDAAVPPQRLSRVISAMMPPSPWLFARITRLT